MAHPDAEPCGKVGACERDDVRRDAVHDAGADDTCARRRTPELTEVGRRPRDGRVGALPGPRLIKPVAAKGALPDVDLCGAAGRELEQVGCPEDVIGDHGSARRVGADGFVELQ